MLVDTPEKLEQLKQGKYNNEYYIDITSGATPNVLLQPQYFANTSFDRITFTSPNGDVLNEIEISPNPVHNSAIVNFVNGINPLSGLPTHYTQYIIQFREKSILTAENIESILQWKQARSLFICADTDNVAGTMITRIDDFGKLDKLTVLTLSMEYDSRAKLKVGTFIKHLPSLRFVTFIGNQMSKKQMEDFQANNEVPANWHNWIAGNYINYERYRKV